MINNNVIITKIKILIIFLFFANIFSLLFLFYPTPAKAEDLYIKNPFDSMQITIPGMDRFTDAKQCSDDENKLCISWLGEYIVGIYKYAIGIIGILATIVMMIGGFIWLTAGGNQSRIGEAKSWIGASLTGLIIALSSYLILYQINPDLTKFAPLKVAWVKPTILKEVEITEGTLTDNSARTKLQENGISVKDNKCTTTYTNQNTKVTYPCCSCTSLEGIPQTAINGLLELKGNCTGCSLKVTGGTEYGHTTHGPGKAIIDLESDTYLNNYIISNKADTKDKGSYKTSSETIYIRSYYNGNDKKWYDMEYTKSGTKETIHHWHISY